ncbi:NPC intracellular cholesterol transporter 2 [Exaiptasia diaphana]|uniref:MD-2-related lipid-recognition domain-containing protein n=1 Tax=Exaiptasia diaphana TaxID=2652724 RepID=A0A913X0M1_EXADI|nr:NPC intracellular cholesterol transporter 2 [Exaiptasia diaphana]KXJ29862.1 Epididymal secretory protein E1 [Exaiptasia diaphana]
MLNLLVFVCLLSVLNLGSCEVVKFTDCSAGKGQGELQQLEITPCPSQPCELKKGTEVSVKATFIPHENVTDAESSVHGKVMGFWVPFPLPNAHACKDSGVKCPLVAGSKYEYSSTLDIKSAYPAISVVVKWQLQDGKGQDLYCFEVSAKIVS